MFNTTTVWRNDWQVDTHAHYEPRAVSDQLTRGGPLMATPGMFDSYVNVRSSPASHLRYGGELFGAAAALGRRTLELSATVASSSDGHGAAQFHLANPDFDRVALRSTAVVRWEWAPGSTLFVVWQQDRQGGLPTGGVAGPELLGDLFSVPGSHTFAVKLAYWSPWL